MEKLLKVLLSVDNNNYKITVKTKTFTNSVPFADFKHFVNEKHQLLFSERHYVWKIYDNDFGEYITLDENTPIYDLSKIVVTSAKAGNERASLESNNSNRQLHDFRQERVQQANIQQHQQQDQFEKPMRQSYEIDLRDFVSAYRSPVMETMQDRAPRPPPPNSFKTFYPSNQSSPNISRPMLSSPMNTGYSNYQTQTSVMSGYNFQDTPRPRGPNPFLNTNPQSQRRILSPPSYYTNLPPTFENRYKPYEKNRQSFPTGNTRKRFLPTIKPTGSAIKKTPVKSQPTKKEPEKLAQPTVPLKKFTFDTLESKEDIVKTILKYNEEFLMISQCDEDIWKTSNIWNFVSKEITGQTDTETIFGIKLAFKEMLKKYVLLLDKDVIMSTADMKKLCPLFDFFHKKLDLRPFHENIEKLKEAFNSNTNDTDTVTSSDDKDVEMLPNIESNKKEVYEKSVEKEINIEFDEKKDMFLLMAVSNFADDFNNGIIDEDEIWSKVAKEVNESADETENIKCKTRFYGLLQQYKELCEKNTASVSGSEKTLKFLFSKMDTSPFEKCAKQMLESDEDCLILKTPNKPTN